MNCVIAAENVGSTAGLGYLITNAQYGLETAKVMGWYGGDRRARPRVQPSRHVDSTDSPSHTHPVPSGNASSGEFRSLRLSDLPAINGAIVTIDSDHGYIEIRTVRRPASMSQLAEVNPSRSPGIGVPESLSPLAIVASRLIIPLTVSP